MLSGRLGRCGYDRWWHSFTGISKETGEKRVFFLEYCIVNPELGSKKPIMGDKQFQRPAYLMVKAGCWGKDTVQQECYYGIEEMDVAEGFLKITAGDCFLSENNMWGRISGEHGIHWSLQINKRVAFHVGYSASKPIREINPFDMYWHAEGMRTDFEGSITVDGVSYAVTPETCYGYADKKWGRDYTSPWFWLYGSQMKSMNTGEPLKNSAFAVGGGTPVVMRIPLWSKPFADVYYEGGDREINYSAPWTFARMKYSCIRKDGKIKWHMKAINTSTAMEIKIICEEAEMLRLNYQTPTGEWNPNQILSGGTGKGEITLYRREFGKLILVDRILVKGAGCEFIGECR